MVGESKSSGEGRNCGEEDAAGCVHRADSRNQVRFREGEQSQHGEVQREVLADPAED